MPEKNLVYYGRHLCDNELPDVQWVLSPVPLCSFFGYIASDIRAEFACQYAFACGSDIRTHAVCMLSELSGQYEYILCDEKFMDYRLV